jgi:hypothetical protein
MPFQYQAGDLHRNFIMHLFDRKMKIYYVMLLIGLSNSARAGINITDISSFEDFIDDRYPGLDFTPRGYIFTTDPDLTGTTSPENPLKIEYNGNGSGGVLIGLNPLPITMNNPNGLLGKESGWMHYSFNVETVTIGEVGIAVFSDAALNPNAKYRWEILSSTSPIKYDSPPALSLENWNGVNPDNFSLLIEENSISLQYSAVPESSQAGLYLALLAIGFALLNRNKNGSNRVAGSIDSPRPHTTGHTGP